MFQPEGNDNDSNNGDNNNAKRHRIEQPLTLESLIASCRCAAVRSLAEASTSAGSNGGIAP